MNPTEASPRSLKRQREDESGICFLNPGTISDSIQQVNSELSQALQEMKSASRESTPTQLNTSDISSRLSSPAPTVRSRNGSLTGTATSVAARSPSTAAVFVALSGKQPPKKRIKLSAAERDIRDRKIAEDKATREEQKRIKEHEKTQRDAERGVERQMKEAEAEKKRQARESKKAEKEKEQKIKDEAKQLKEAEKQKQDDEKRKKERAQPTIFEFLKTPATVSTKTSSPSPVPCANPTSSLPPTPQPAKNKDVTTQTEYEKRFPTFYIHEGVTLAPITRFESDDFHKQSIRRAIDNHISGETVLRKTPFDPYQLFNTTNLDLTLPSKTKISVREIMSQILGLGDSSQPIDLTGHSQIILSEVKKGRDLLQKVPYKFFSFAEDVRPPYKGTYTQQPPSEIRKLARHPMKRRFHNINYDYDSEAEWEAPGEGEDLDSDGEEEEDVDGDDDIDGFLDDENDELANVRKLKTVQGDLEVKSTGLCWENVKKSGPNLEIYRYRMEILDGFHDKISAKKPIDPFSTSYWNDGPAIMMPLRMPLNAMKTTSSSVNGPNKPVKMFGVPDSTKPKATPQNSKAPKGPVKMVAAQDMPAFKLAIQGSNLSKIGLIEVLNKQFSKTSKAAVKATLEAVAHRVGTKEAEKRWVLLEDP